MTHWSSWLANRHVLKPVPCHDVRLGSMFFKKTMEFFWGKKKKKSYTHQIFHFSQRILLQSHNHKANFQITAYIFVMG